MEQTLGKRIMLHRKQLNLTQDQLAEQLGVTAQAVSKWENDQSCPDITTLPKLAAIFGITTDELLGHESTSKVHQAEVISEDEQDTGDVHVQNGRWEFRWDSRKKNAIGFAVWVLAVGILYFCARWFVWDISLWDILWPSGLMFWGLLGLFPKFSLFRLGCSVSGGYFLFSQLVPMDLPVSGELILPVILILWGLSLLADALRKKRTPGVRIYRDGKRIYSNTKRQEDCSTGEQDFNCCGSFCEKNYLVHLDQLISGNANVSFGEMTIDLSGVQSVSKDCEIELNCSFGELTLLVPRHFLVDCQDNTSFGSIDFSGTPDPDSQGIITVDANVSFGDIAIRYI